MNELTTNELKLLESMEDILIPNGYSRHHHESTGEFRKQITITPETTEDLYELFIKYTDAVLINELVNTLKGGESYVRKRLEQLKELENE